MSANSYLALTRGVPRMAATAMPYAAVYDQDITIVTSGATGNQLNGPVTSGTNITLPSSKTYSQTELELYLNGQKLDYLLDWNVVGSVPRTQVSLTQTLVAGDVLKFVINRPA